jgi:uncharacterized protein (TIGR00251 family)
VIPLDETSGSVRFAVHVQPRASRTEVAGVHGDALKVRLQAAPVEGAANAALIALLAEVLGVPERGVTILGGATARLKRVAIAGISAVAVRDRLFSRSDNTMEKRKARR